MKRWISVIVLASVLAGCQDNSTAPENDNPAKAGISIAEDQIKDPPGKIEFVKWKVVGQIAIVRDTETGLEFEICKDGQVFKDCPPAA